MQGQYGSNPCAQGLPDADVPTRRVRDGNPIGDAVIQPMIDAMAAEVVAAIR